MELSIFWAVTLRELREALRNKWLILYAAGFTLLAFALSRTSLASAGYSGLGGFGRTAASLVNALLLFVPLLGLTIGATSLAGDLERGTLLYLLAQPVNRGEVFLGKAFGAALAIIAALFTGFGLAALVLSTGSGGDASAYIGLIGFSILLLLASLGLGFLISALTRKSGAASGAALLVWLGLVFLGDLGLVGATLTLQPTPAVLLAMLLANPLQSFKLGAIYSLRSNLDALGTVGQYAAYSFGSSLPVLLASLLLAWSVIAFGAAFMIFHRRRDL